MSQVLQSPADLGAAGWNALLPARKPRSQLQEDFEADYLIVGAGFAGLSAARRISQLASGARIVILEAHEVGQGPAGRNSGFMVDLPHTVSSSNYAGAENEDLRQTRMNRTAIQFARNMVEEFKLPDETFDHCGKTNAAASRQGIKNNTSYARHLDRLDEPCRLLDQNDMQSITGSDYYQGGLWTPGTAIIQPALYIRGIADGLTQRSDIWLYENSAVTEIGKRGDRWEVKAGFGSVVADKAILAVNGLIENFGYYKKHLMHINLYASLTRELKQEEVAKLGGESSWGFTPSDPLGSSVRRISGTGGHRILIRNRCTYDPKLKLPSNAISRVAVVHDRSFIARFPMLEQVEMEYRWSGRLCLSLNDVWALGEIDENLYSACCQNGLGTTKGTIAGILAAEMAYGDDQVSLLPDYKKQAQPKKLYPEPFMSLGSRTYLRFREWRAGRDL